MTQNTTDGSETKILTDRIRYLDEEASLFLEDPNISHVYVIKFATTMNSIPVSLGDKARNVDRIYPPVIPIFQIKLLETR